MEKNIWINTENEVLECANCGEDIEPGDEYVEMGDGSVLCPGCFDFAYPECEFCGKRVSEDDMLFWGDCHCCPECYEGFNPSFDPDENERETTEAYEAMLKRYIGRKSKTVRDDTVDMELECTDCGLVVYRMEVDVDEDGIIYEISRLTAEIMLSESERSSSWEDYIIRNEDYTDKVDKMMKDLCLED